MRILSIIIHVWLKEIIAMDVTRENFVLTHQFLSYSVRKISTRSYGYMISFMCLSGILNEVVKGQSCFIRVITDLSSQQWRNVVTPTSRRRRLTAICLSITFEKLSIGARSIRRMSIRRNQLVATCM
jgi:hypothetical protein